MAKHLPKSTQINRHIYNAFDSLEDERDKLYVEMAVYGYPYRTIALKARREHQTVKKWFMKGGRLHNAYKYRIKEHRAEFEKHFKQVKELLKYAAVDAALKLGEAVREEGLRYSNILAAKTLLTLAGFDHIKKIDSNVTVKTDPAAAEAAKKLQDFVADLEKKSKKNLVI